MSTEISLDAMTDAEKLALLERLWNDLSRRPEQMPAPAWHGTVLADRIAAVRESRKGFSGLGGRPSAALGPLRSRIRILPEAKRDLEVGADFYESQSPGLGSCFIDCLPIDFV